MGWREGQESKLEVWGLGCGAALGGSQQPHQAPAAALPPPPPIASSSRPGIPQWVGHIMFTPKVSKFGNSAATDRRPPSFLPCSWRGHSWTRHLWLPRAQAHRLGTRHKVRGVRAGSARGDVQTIGGPAGTQTHCNPSSPWSKAPGLGVEAARSQLCALGPATCRGCVWRDRREALRPGAQVPTRVRSTGDPIPAGSSPAVPSGSQGRLWAWPRRPPLINQAKEHWPPCLPQSPSLQPVGQVSAHAPPRGRAFPESLEVEDGLPSLALQHLGWAGWAGVPLGMPPPPPPHPDPALEAYLSGAPGVYCVCSLQKPKVPTPVERWGDRSGSTPSPAVYLGARTPAFLPGVRPRGTLNLDSGQDLCRKRGLNGRRKRSQG